MSKNPWQNYSALILDKISMVFLRLLGMIKIHLSQAKSKNNNDTAVFDSLVLVVVIGNFYQFPPVIGRSL